MLPIDFDLIGTLEQSYENETAAQLLYCFSMLQNSPSTIEEIVETFNQLRISYPTTSAENFIRCKMNNWNQFADLHQLGSIHHEDTVLFLKFSSFKKLIPIFL